MMAQHEHWADIQYYYILADDDMPQLTIMKLIVDAGESAYDDNTTLTQSISSF